MVLSRTWLVPVLALSLALAAGCLHSGNVAKTGEPVEVVVAFVHENGRDGHPESPPAKFSEAVLDDLRAKNLRPVVVDGPAAVGSFTGSERRLEHLASSELPALARAGRAGGEALVLLIETSGEFYSQMQGRFRWSVYVNARIADGRAVDKARSVSFNVPAILDFSHQGDEDAVAWVALPAARKLSDFAAQFARERPTITDTSTVALPSADSIYFVMVDRFFNGDQTNDGKIDLGDPAAFHGGDLRGVLDKVDYLHDLGIGTVWLSPVFKTRTSKFHGHGAFHGYWTEDLGQVDPRFGTEDDLRRLSAALAERGMGLVLDVVLNHVSFDAALTREKPDWFHTTGSIEDWNDPKELIEGQVHGLPDLAQERPEVADYLIAQSVGWIKKISPAGLRLDAVKHVPLSFWRQHNGQARKAGQEGFRLIGEYFDGAPSALAATWRDGDFDTLFDFPLHYAMVDVFCKNKSPVRLAEILSLDRLYPDASELVTFLDNHDLPRIQSACAGDDKRVDRALTFLLATRGVPSFTYGTEVAMSGAREPENRGDMSFGAHDLGERIRTGLRWRRQHPALSEGQLLVLEVDQEVFAYARLTAREAAIVVVNSGADPLAVPLPEFLASLKFVALDSGKTVAGIELIAPGNAVSVYTAEGDFESQAAALRHPASRSISLKVSGAPAGDVIVVGSSPELGSWQAAKAPRLAAGTLGLPVGTVATYKLAVNSNDATTWEDRDNRFLFVEPGDGPLEVGIAWAE